MADDREALQDLREKLIRIESLLENINNTNTLKLETVDEKIKVANRRILDLENSIMWLWRTIVGGVLTAAIAFLFNN